MKMKIKKIISFVMAVVLLLSINFTFGTTETQAAETTIMPDEYYEYLQALEWLDFGYDNIVSYEFNGVDGKYEENNNRACFSVKTETTSSSFMYTDFLNIYYEDVGSVAGRSINAVLSVDALVVAEPYGNIKSAFSGYVGIFFLQKSALYIGYVTSHDTYFDSVYSYKAEKEYTITITLTYADTGETVDIPFLSCASDIDSVVSSDGSVCYREGWEGISGFSGELFIYESNNTEIDGLKVLASVDNNSAQDGATSYLEGGAYAPTINGTMTMKYWEGNCTTAFQVSSAYAQVDAPTKSVDNSNVYKSGEIVQWSITQDIGEQYAAIISPYTSFVISDYIPEGVTYQSAKVYDNSGNDVTEEYGTFDYDSSSRILTYTINSSLLKSVDFYAQNLTLVIDTIVDGSVIGEIDNTATTLISGEEYASNTVSINVIDKIKVIVYYIDEDGNSLAENQIITGYSGDTYETEELVFDGYNLVEAPSNAASTMAEETIEVTYVYALKDVTVISHYVDEDGNELADDESAEYKWFDTYETIAKDITGYELVEIPSNAEGTVDAETIEVTYVYALKEATVISHYVDEDGNEVAEEESAEYNWFDTYETTAKEITGYELVVTPSNAEGTVNAEIIEVTYVYTLKEATVISHYVDEDGNEVAEEESAGYSWFDTYETTAKEITGYELVETPSNAEGTVDAETIEVTYVYALKEATVISHYVDEGGNEVAEDESAEYKWYDTYETTAKGITGYELVETPSNAEGTVDAETIEVTYVYKLKTGVVIVYYVDTDGNLLLDSLTTEYNWFDEYTTAEETISGWTLSSITGNETGIIENEVTEVVYIYEQNEEESIAETVAVEEESKETDTEESLSVEQETEKETISHTPKTGNNNVILFGIMFIMSLMGLCVMRILKRLRN